MARKKRRRVASRGSVNNIILKSLVEGDKYGYEIIKDVEEFSNGKIQLKQPSLYSSLSRFEEKQYVTSYWGDSDIGGRRHYYHLTELGLQYYKKAVLKEGNDDAEDYEEDENLDYNVDEDEEVTSNENQYVTEGEEPMSNDNYSPSNNSEVMTYQEIPETEIPAIVDFESNNTEEQTIIPDHAYYKSTPMENLITEQDNQSNNQESIIDNTSNTETYEESSTQNEEESISQDNDTTPPWIRLSNSVKKSNERISNSKFNTMYFRKPKREQKIILDKDGIYKLRDDDYTPQKRNSKPIIIDNVGKRTAPVDVYGYSTYINTPKKSTQKAYSELTEEEKRKRNENFLAKFNLLTNSKMKPISTPAPKVEEKKPEKPIDYRGKLDAIIESNQVPDEEPVDDDPIVDIEENNLFNYKEEDDWDSDNSLTQETVEESGQIDLEPAQEFETKTNEKQYIEKINNYSSSSQVKINRYDSKPKAILIDKTFVLINKLRCVFGVIMSILMLLELTLSYFIIKNNNLIMKGDSTLIIVSYVVVVLFACIYTLPYCFNKNQHKVNNFKFKYAMWFGILTFLVLSILIYCINALAGFELDNIKYFVVKFTFPLLLSFNFVIGPIVYVLLNKKQTFYD